jgi:hypothetical protein
MNGIKQMKRGPNKAKRTERTILGGMKQKLNAPERKGFHRRWFNDNGTRIHDAQSAGYEFVTDDQGKTTSDSTSTRIMQVVGTKEDGSPLHAYLMEKPQKFYDQDQAIKQKEVDVVDDAIRKGGIAGKPGQDGRYIPQQGINIR